MSWTTSSVSPNKKTSSPPTYPTPTPTWPTPAFSPYDPTATPPDVASALASYSRWRATHSGAPASSVLYTTYSSSGVEVVIAYATSYIYNDNGSSASPSTFLTNGGNIGGYGVSSNGNSTAEDANPAISSGVAIEDNQSGGGPGMGVKVGMAVGAAITILGLILGIVCCRRHRRKRERYNARDMRERGREDGMGHFDVLESPVESTSSAPSSSPMVQVGASATQTSLLPPTRPFDMRGLPAQHMGVNRYERAYSVGGSSTGAPGSSAWEDDSEADVMANDGSTLARTMSTASTGSLGSEGTVRGVRDSIASSAIGMDHPAYTYMSRRPAGSSSALGHGAGTGTYVGSLTPASASPFADPVSDSSISSTGHLAPSPSATLYSPATSRSGPSTLASSQRDHAQIQQSRNLHRLSTVSVSSAGSTGTAGTGLTGTTRTTLPEYTYMSTGPELLPAHTATVSPAESAGGTPFADDNPFADPTLPTYEGTLSRSTGARRGECAGRAGMVQRDGPPAYSF